MLPNLGMYDLLTTPHKPLNPILIHGAEIRRISGRYVATDHIGIFELKSTVLLTKVRQKKPFKLTRRLEIKESRHSEVLRPCKNALK